MKAVDGVPFMLTNKIAPLYGHLTMAGFPLRERSSSDVVCLNLSEVENVVGVRRATKVFALTEGCNQGN